MPTTTGVELNLSPTRYSTDLSLRELRQAALVHHYQGPIVGAYYATINYVADVDRTVKEISPSRFCATPKYITLRLTLDQTIYIPRDFTGDNCLSSLARDHEGKHANAETSAVERLRPAFLSALRSAIRDNPSDSKPSAAEALSALKKLIKSAIERVLDQIDTERARLNLAVDTSVEFEQLSHACEGRALQ